MMKTFRLDNKMATMAISNNINELDILLQVCILSCIFGSTRSSRNAISKTWKVRLTSLGPVCSPVQWTCGDPGDLSH